MPYVGQKPADIISTAVDTVTGTFSGALDVKGAAVFNEDSADVDFRVESNANANMIFVDGGNNKVGINDDVPVGLLSIKGGDSGVTAAQGHANELVIENNTNGGITFNCGASNSATLLFQNSTNADDGAITYRNSEREFRFKTAGAEQVRIHSNGVLSASDGVALGVGTANTASNVLDDYEEGDYTVTFTCSSSGTITLKGANNQASYTKVGRLVHASGYIIVESVSSPAGFLRINLPFTPANLTDTSGFSAVSLYVNDINSANVADFVGYIPESDAQIYIQLGDAVSGQNDSANQFKANSALVFSASYHTT